MKNENPRNTDQKNSLLKQSIISLMINRDSYSIADLSRELNISIPTITKLVMELIEEGVIQDSGKLDTNGGRRPNLYGLNPQAGHFVGIDIRHDDIGIAVIDFKGNIKNYHETSEVEINDTEESFIAVCDMVKRHLADVGIKENSIMAYGVNLSGRVNRESGYCFTHSLEDDRPIGEIIEREFQATVFVENDSRAMTYGEYLCGAGCNKSQMLFFNVTWGLGMGMIIDGKLSYGKSGYSGEIGHFTMLGNDQICRCGKTGCLETGASGTAMHRIVINKLNEGRNSKLATKFAEQGDLSMDDILDAVHDEDLMAIEVVEEIGTTLGKAIAGMINLFNPELVVIGGRVAEAGEYLLMPIKIAVQKYSLNIISKDTTITFSKLGRMAGPIGACMLSRSKVLGLI